MSESAVPGAAAVGRRLLHVFARLPGINAGLIAETDHAGREHGLHALFTSALAGQPYRLFAVQAGAGGASFSTFLFASAVARFGRFTSTAAIAWLAGFCLRRRPESLRLWLHALVWAAFYLVYFLSMR